MPTCCVCHGYYNVTPYTDPTTQERFGPKQCVRCRQFNHNWENARQAGLGDLFSRYGARALLVLSPIFVEFTLLAFMFSSSLWGTTFRRSELLLAFFFTLLSLVLAWLCYNWRFRARDDSLLRSLAVVKGRSVFRLFVQLPIIAVALTFVWIMILWVAANQPPEAANKLPWNAINRPGSTLLLLFLLMTSITPAPILAVVRRYVDSFDLPQPIFLDLPLMRKVVIQEYLGQPVIAQEPQGQPTATPGRPSQLSAMPGRPSQPSARVEYHEIARTPQGGLSMTVKLQRGEKSAQVRLESDPWARLLSAKESGPY